MRGPNLLYSWMQVQNESRPFQEMYDMYKDLPVVE
jgi:hypothetical protein